MNVKRKEVLPGIFLTCIQSDKFKSAFTTVSLLTQLSKETAALNALVPFVLCRGTTSYPDMKKISEHLDEMYGSVLQPVVRCVGEIQCPGLAALFPEDKFLPEGANVAANMFEMLAETLLRPATRGGLFLPAYVDSEKQNAIDNINSMINDKRVYSLNRCIEQMCLYEDLAAGTYGHAEDYESINYQKLTKHYHKLLQTSPVEIFYCGRMDATAVESLVMDSFVTFPRGDIDYDIGTDIRMNTLEAESRYFEENLDVTQGKLVIGFRLGDCMEDPDIPAIKVFNTVFGSGTTSKLFTVVREKLQLCYYASSRVDCNKGLLLAMSGIEIDKFDEAKDAILGQLEEMRNGNISDEELSFAKTALISDMNAVEDKISDLSNFYFVNTVCGLEWSPQEYAGLVEEVTKEDVVSIANSVECDLVYFLRDKKDDDDDEEN